MFDEKETKKPDSIVMQEDPNKKASCSPTSNAPSDQFFLKRQLGNSYLQDVADRLQTQQTEQKGAISSLQTPDEVENDVEEPQVNEPSLADASRYLKAVQAALSESEIIEPTPEVMEAINRTRGGGLPLDSGPRAEMEPFFQADFSDIRIHTDIEADRLSRALKAQAFTTGTDIFFRQGEYDTQSVPVQTLLVHELTHLIQQTGSRWNLRSSVRPAESSVRGTSHGSRPALEPFYHSLLPLNGTRMSVQRQTQHEQEQLSPLIPISSGEEESLPPLVPIQSEAAVVLSEAEIENAIKTNTAENWPDWLIEKLQRFLHVKLSGIMDNSTVNAIAEWQIRNGMGGTGILEEPLLEKIAPNMLFAPGKLTAEEIQDAIKSNNTFLRDIKLGKGRVAEIQGYLRVNSSGTIDKATVIAIAQWQARHRYPWTGRLDQLLLKEVFWREWSERLEEDLRPIYVDPKVVEHIFDDIYQLTLIGINSYIVKANLGADRFEDYAEIRVKSVQADWLFKLLISCADIAISVISQPYKTAVKQAIKLINEVEKSFKKKNEANLREIAHDDPSALIKIFVNNAKDFTNKICQEVEDGPLSILNEIITKTKSMNMESYDWSIFTPEEIDLIIQFYLLRGPEEKRKLLETLFGIPFDSNEIYIRFYRELVLKFEEMFIYEVEAAEKDFGEREKMRIEAEAIAEERAKIEESKLRKHIQTASPVNQLK